MSVTQVAQESPTQQSSRDDRLFPHARRSTPLRDAFLAPTVTHPRPGQLSFTSPSK